MIGKILRLQLTIILVLILNSCTTISTPSRNINVVKNKVIYLQEVCKRHNAVLAWDSILQVITINWNNLNIRAMVGSDIVFIGDKRILLSEPVKTINSAIAIPEDFEKLVFSHRRIRIKSKIVSSNKSYRSYAFKKIKSILIDAGHGGKDPGAIGRTGLYEKKVVIDIAKRVRKVLKGKGFGVIMTRKRDHFVTLGKRTEMASSAKADVYVSIHANSSPQKKVYGVEVYSLKHLGYREKHEEQRQRNYRKLCNVLKIKKNNRDLQNIIVDMYDSNKQIESDKLAKIVNLNLVKMLKTRSNGVKKSHFYVLRNTIVPSILVEVGYLSNPREERLFKTKAYRQKVANAIARGIIEYANM